jgi:hypothetical protein
MVPFSFSILNFLKTGYIGPLCVSLSCSEVRDILGEPQMIFYRRERGKPGRYLTWKYGSLYVVFQQGHTVRKLVLHPVRPGQFPKLPDAMTSVSGYPTSDLDVWYFENYAKQNKLDYFMNKSPDEPRYYTIQINWRTNVYFSRTGLKSMWINASPYD